MKIELLSLDEIDPCQLAIHANDPLVNRYLKNSFPFGVTNVCEPRCPVLK